MYAVVPQDIRNAAYGIDIPEGATVDGQLTALIAKAETRLNAVVPSLAARFEAGEELGGQPIGDVVKGVVEDMVLRVAKNPEALRSFGIDDFQAVLDNAVSSGRLYVAADEETLLSPGSGRAKVGSILLGVPSWRMPYGC